MSYEGYEEYICENKHYFAVDSFMFGEDVCPHCGAKPAYYHSVDVTNGEIEDEPGTQPAPYEEVGFEDEWHTDHYGNKFATKIIHVEPPKENSQWRPYRITPAVDQSIKTD